MNVSIQDMQSAASGTGFGQGFNQGPPINISQEIGNVIEVTELTDDLGLNLLANQAKSKPDGAQGFGSAPIRLSVPDEPTKSIQFDTLEPIDLNSFGGFIRCIFCFIALYLTKHHLFLKRLQGK